MGRKVRVGVAADDITGANDIGVMLAQNGYVSVVMSLADGPSAADFEGADALIINTGSRLDRPETAAEKSYRAAKLLVELGCERIHAKTCSVFRGNIGASFDAVQDAVGASCSMVVLGFPRNGRVTKHGLHYVNGTLLERSSFASDPVTPMRQSRLKDIIARQSLRPCAEFPYEWLDEPPERQRAHLEALRRENRYIVFDVRDQRDLRTIAALVRDEKSLCGASALCQELPRAWGCAGEAAACAPETDARRGVLIVSGSLTPQTLAQTALLRERGVAEVMLSPVCLADEAERGRVLPALAARTSALLAVGEDALLCVEQDSAPAREMGRRLGMDSAQIGRLIGGALEELTRAVRARTGVSRILVAGGETSDAVSRALGVRTMRIWQEIEPGVPLMTGRTRAGEELLLVFKSGSFGSERFLWTALQQLKGGKEA